jgi:hypothetical protein
MKTVSICKAQSTVETVPVESVTITIDQPIPDFPKLGMQDEFTAQEAVDLEQALYDVLPGATYKRLYAVMACREADFNHLHVALP